MGIDQDLTPQVSFFRPNLTFKVVNKSSGVTPGGKPASLEALVNYIRQGSFPIQFANSTLCLAERNLP